MTNLKIMDYRLRRVNHGLPHGSGMHAPKPIGPGTEQNFNSQKAWLNQSEASSKIG